MPGMPFRIANRAHAVVAVDQLAELLAVYLDGNGGLGFGVYEFYRRCRR
jgi:hypothetical protein